jgi:hypothetical protein
MLLGVNSLFFCRGENMPTVKEVIKHLQRYKQSQEHIATAIWSEEDVLERAKERNIKITRKQAQDIIDRIDQKQDATTGITWDTIDCYLDDLQ